MATLGKGDSLKINGRYLHSPYNPQEEARRIVRGFPLGDKTLFLLFEPGGGYMIPALAERVPRARFLVITPLDKLDRDLTAGYDIRQWTGKDDKDAFLWDNIHGADRERLAYFPWPPSVRLLPDEAAEWTGRIKDFLIRLSANHANLRTFGKRNLRNGLINWLEGDPPRLPSIEGRKVLIIASGPSLNRTIKIIKGQYKGYVIIALPSSAAILSHHGIIPDLIFSTDSGYWATRHFEFFPPECPIGHSLTAACGRSSKHSILFRERDWLNDLFLKKVGLPWLDTATTVAYSAIRFALAGGASSLTLAGLDLSMDDIKSHGSPHSFSSLLSISSKRFEPLQSLYFYRALEMGSVKVGRTRFGKSLNHFKRDLSGLATRVPLFRLCPGTPSLEGWREVTQLSPGPESPLKWRSLPWPDRRKRNERVREVIRLLNLPISDMEVLLNKEDIMDNRAFNLLYSLFPEEMSRLRKDVFAPSGVGNEGSLEDLREKLYRLSRRMEALIERLS